MHGGARMMTSQWTFLCLWCAVSWTQQPSRRTDIRCVRRGKRGSSSAGTAEFHTWAEDASSACVLCLALHLKCPQAPHKWLPPMADWEDGMNLLGDLHPDWKHLTKSTIWKRLSQTSCRVSLVNDTSSQKRSSNQKSTSARRKCACSLFLIWIPDVIPDNITAFLVSVAFAHVADGGAHGGAVLLPRAHVWGLVTKVSPWGSNLAAHVFFPFFFCCLLFGSCFFGTICQCRGEIIVHTADKRRDIILLPFTLLPRWFSLRSRFKHPAVLFAFLHSSCLFYSNGPIFLSSFYLMTPLFSHSSPFAWGDPICLLSSFSFPFLPSPSLLSPPPLLPVSVHRPSTLSSNSITFSLLLFFQLLCFNLFLLLPPTRLEILILGIWHSFALSSASLFILLSPVYHFLPSIAVSRSLYYLLNWSPSLPIFNRNFALAWIMYV